MSVLFAVLCGMIQGAAEFLPVSSSGHLALLQNVFMKDPSSADLLAFNVLLHLGTLVAVLTVYGKTVLRLIPAFFTAIAKAARREGGAALTREERMAVMTVLGTLPMAAAKLIGSRVEAVASSVTAVGALLMINAAILAAGERAARKKRRCSDPRPASAIAVGLAQCFAVLPGISRSGSSISAGLACGYDRSFAVDLSFIMSIPAIAGAALFELPDVFRRGVPGGDLAAYISGAAAAFICGTAAVRALRSAASGRGFGGYAVYSAAVGAISVAAGITDIRFPVF